MKGQCAGEIALKITIIIIIIIIISKFSFKSLILMLVNDVFIVAI